MVYRALVATFVGDHRYERGEIVKAAEPPNSKFEPVDTPKPDAAGDEGGGEPDQTKQKGKDKE